MRIDLYRISASCWNSCHRQQLFVVHVTDQSYFGVIPIVNRSRNGDECLDPPIAWNAWLTDNGLQYCDAALLVVHLEHVKGGVKLLSPSRLCERCLRHSEKMSALSLAQIRQTVMVVSTMANGPCISVYQADTNKVSRKSSIGWPYKGYAEIASVSRSWAHSMQERRSWQKLTL